MFDIITEKKFLLFILPFIADYDEWADMSQKIIEDSIEICYGEMFEYDSYSIKFSTREVTKEFIEHLNESEIEWFITMNKITKCFDFKAFIHVNNSKDLVEDITRIICNTKPSDSYLEMMEDIDIIYFNEYQEIYFTESFKSLMLYELDINVSHTLLLTKEINLNDPLPKLEYNPIMEDEHYDCYTTNDNNYILDSFNKLEFIKEYKIYNITETVLSSLLGKTRIFLN